MLASFVGTLLAPPGGNAKCLGRDCLSSTEIRKNSSELRNLSSEVLYPGSVENFRFLGSYWEIPPWGMRLVGKASQKKKHPHLLCGEGADAICCGVAFVAKPIFRQSYE